MRLQLWRSFQMDAFFWWLRGHDALKLEGIGCRFLWDFSFREGRQPLQQNLRILVLLIRTFHRICSVPWELQLEPQPSDTTDATTAG